MKKYKIYFETEDGLKKIHWSNTMWLHRKALLEDGLDWYTTTIKKYGIFIIYRAPFSITKVACDNCDYTFPYNIVED